MPEPDTVKEPSPIDIEKEEWIGKGDARFVYLDENYNPTTNDIGKMAMYVENNELTKDLFVLAEIQNDNIDNDVVVRVVNRENNSLVSFFYYRGQYFPHKTVITIDGEDIIGRFSPYNMHSETYSVEFTYEDGESDSFQNFILNKNIFLQQKDDDALTDTQNVRLRHIITTLALWTSMAFQIDDNFQVSGRAIGWLKKLSVALVFVAIIAVAVVLAPALPAAFSVVGATIVVPVTTTVQVIAAGVAIGAGVGAVIADILAEELDKPNEPSKPFPGNQSPPPSNPERRPKIDITLDNAAVENNGPTYYLKYDLEKEEGESLTFNLKITDKAVYSHSDIINTSSLVYWFDPNLKRFIESNLYNAEYLDVTINGDINDVLSITISRNDIEGYNRDGRVQIVLKLCMDVIINGRNNDGISFWSDWNEPVDNRKDIFVLNFTVLEPENG